MRQSFHIGDTQTFQTTVTAAKLARFPAGEVHPVYGTFALGQDAEWVCRLFVLEMKEEGEEGIGTFLELQHKSPAVLGSEVHFVATFSGIIEGEIICHFEARVGDRLIASGRTGQKIIDKARFDAYLASLK